MAKKTTTKATPKPAAKATKPAAAVKAPKAAPAVQTPAQVGDELDLDETSPVVDAVPADEATAEAVEGEQVAELGEPTDEAGQPQQMQAEYAKGFDVFDMDAAKLTMKHDRAHYNPQRIAELARDIGENGLANPIVIGSDLVIIAGDRRFLAMTDKLGRKVVPCRIAVDPKTGEQITSTTARGMLQTASENIHRENPSPIDLSRTFNNLLAAKVAANANELAKRLSLSPTTVSRILSITDKGSPALQEALSKGLITQDAAAALIARAQTHEAQDALLKILLDASEGKAKIGVSDVNAKAPASGKGSGGSKAGRKPGRAAISAEATDADESGIRLTLRKGAKRGHWIVAVDMEIAAELDTFARFDLARKIQAAAARLDNGKVKAALEEARDRLA